MAVRIEIHDSIDDVPAEAWDAAVAASGAPIFYSREYLSAYEKSLLHGVDEHIYIVVSRSGNVTDHAVLPVVRPSVTDALDVIASAFPDVDAEAPGLVSAGWHCYDGWIPATRPDATLFEVVVEVMTDIARDRSVSWCALANISEDSALSGALPDWDRRARLGDERYTMDLTPYDGFDSYVATLPRRSRQHLRRYARRAAEAGLSAACLSPADADLDGVLELARLTASRYGVTDFYRPSAFQDFVTRLGRSGLVFELRVDDELIAGGVCMAEPTRFHQWTFGVDYDPVKTFSPYAMLFAETMRAALASGVPMLEGGRRNGIFKTRYGLARRALYTYLAPIDGRGP